MFERFSTLRISIVRFVARTNWCDIIMKMSRTYYTEPYIDVSGVLSLQKKKKKIVSTLGNRICYNLELFTCQLD